MKLRLIGHQDRYAVEQLQLALFPLEPMEYTEAPFDGDGAVSTLHRGAVWLTATTCIAKNGQCHKAVKRLRVSEETVRLRRRILQQSYYLAALPLLDQAPPWGALSGVRPTKITTKHLMEGGTPRSADRLMRDTYFVSPQRSALAIDCSAATVKAASLLEPSDVSLYVGIPFCPTRCTYCSFVSRTIGRRTELLEPYLQALLTEIRHTGKLLESSGKTLRTIYIGGGTPTTLSSDQLQRLMCCIRESFDLSRCIEFTVEGGRPDTLDQQKLDTIARCGADRVSINPQTMIDSVLCACGRIHGSAEIRKAYQQAVQSGFKAINMDLIAGLPTDGFDGFRRSLNEVLELAPENITVHTLAIKKGADLYDDRRGLPPQQEVAAMVNYAEEALRGAGYLPYYLYRQKYMSGSFENVGWCKPGTECLYNIYMMEELHTIISVGGGGMNKVNLPDGTLKRFHNPKFPEQYIEMLDEVLRQKEELFDLMKGSI